jgi:DNA-binding SARP family transcriptional activator
MRAFPFPREEEPAPLASGQVVVRLRLIGHMEAWTVTSENVLPAGRKTRALLAAVALAGPRPALRGRLAELLWSRRLEEQARASLRQEIHRLLEVLAPAQTDVLQVTRDHLSLKPGAVWIDVEEVMRATTAEPAALALLDGELLEDLIGIDPTFDMWLTAERERLATVPEAWQRHCCASNMNLRPPLRRRSVCCKSTARMKGHGEH